MTQILETLQLRPSKEVRRRYPGQGGDETPTGKGLFTAEELLQTKSPRLGKDLWSLQGSVQGSGWGALEQEAKSRQAGGGREGKG